VSNLSYKVFIINEKWNDHYAINQFGQVWTNQYLFIYSTHIVLNEFIHHPMLDLNVFGEVCEYIDVHDQ